MRSPSLSMTDRCSTTTTTIVLCHCNVDDPGFTFIVGKLGKFNNDGFLSGTIAARKCPREVRPPDRTNVAFHDVRGSDSPSVSGARSS